MWAMIKQLRILSTVLLAFSIAQAGLGSGFLDGVEPLLIAHLTNAFAVLVLTILSAVLGFYFAGPADRPGRSSCRWRWWRWPGSRSPWGSPARSWAVTSSGACSTSAW